MISYKKEQSIFPSNPFESSTDKLLQICAKNKDE